MHNATVVSRSVACPTPKIGNRMHAYIETEQRRHLLAVEMGDRDRGLNVSVGRAHPGV